MVWIIAFFTLLGANFSFWAIVSFLRFIHEKIPHKHVKKRGRPAIPIRESDVAAIIPARNEELTILKTLRPLLKVLPKKNIYVADDASTDKTEKKAHLKGVNVYTIRPNVGKARALVKTMKRYNLLNRFKAILIHDADVEIDKNYMKEALPIFSDKQVAAVAPHQRAYLRSFGFYETFFIAYRVRLWRILQMGVRFGQTWNFTNVTYIVPGGLSVYRTKVLRKIKIDAPGLIIEDFNMTFELHKKKLGKVAYKPSIIGKGQDPYYLKDYVKQVWRWNLGFWQTVKRNGIWPSFFWLSTGSYIIEMTLYATFTLLIPVFLLLLYLNSFQPLTLPIVQMRLSFNDLLIGLFFMDYVTTVVAALFERKHWKVIMLLYGVGFFLLRYVDAFIYLATIPQAFFTKSTGQWKSPQRKPVKI